MLTSRAGLRLQQVTHTHTHVHARACTAHTHGTHSHSQVADPAPVWRSKQKKKTSLCQVATDLRRAGAARARSETGVVVEAVVARGEDEALMAGEVVEVACAALGERRRRISMSTPSPRRCKPAPSRAWTS